MYVHEYGHEHTLKAMSISNYIILLHFHHKQNEQTKHVLVKDTHIRNKLMFYHQKTDAISAKLL